MRSILAPRALSLSLPQAAFQLFWCVYGFLHFALTAHLWLPWQGIRHLSLAAWLLAAWTLARPASLPRVAILVAVRAAADLVSLPFVPNHVLLTLFVNLTLLVAMAEAAWRRRRQSELAPLAVATFAAFAPLARLEF